MPDWRIQYATRAEKDLQKLDTATREDIIRAVDGLLEKPPQGDLKMLTAMKGLWRIRVGDWRIIYSRNKATKTFLIARILRRSTTTY